MESGARGTSMLRRLLRTLSALVVATTLLVVGLLSLIQVRRTMVPLERPDRRDAALVRTRLQRPGGLASQR